mgnify:CR=1 FL=1
MENQTFWQQYRGYIFLSIVVLLLFVGSIVAQRGEDETAVSESSVVLPEADNDSQTETIKADSEFLQVDTAVSVEGLHVVSDTSLAPDPNPRTYTAKMPSHNFQVHVVTDFDTPNSIAEQYGISSETLIGGNPQMSRESNLLQTGAELIILPIDGVLHTVAPGETLESIAELYEVSVADIVNYESNNLEEPFLRLVPEAQLVIPGASVGQFYFTAPKSVNNSGGAQEWAVVGTGTYIWPISGRCITQFYGGFHAGLDVSSKEGAAAYASDTGTVTYASYAAGVYYDYGNLIVINHGNGFETFYAHLSGINVYPGQIVNQGDLIGYTGNTGRSSGPHIHFEIRQNDFQTNPLSRLGGGYSDCT